MINKINKNELVTIYCLLYNQEKYVEKSVNSLLHQDYGNLQIIISDDCSCDKTYEIAQKLVKNYKGGHKIILNKNTSNIGLIEHVEKCLSMSEGKWIFQSAGDDISTFTRISDTIRFIKESKENITAAFTNLYIIDEHGNQKNTYFKDTPLFAKNYKDYQSGIKCWAIGASFCFDRVLYDNYGGFVKNVTGEDGCLAFRALLEGNLLFYNNNTVYYRHHDKNLSQNLTLQKKIEFKKKEQWLFINHLKDAELKGMPSHFNNVIRIKVMRAFFAGWLLNTSFIKILFLLEKIKKYYNEK